MTEVMEEPHGAANARSLWRYGASAFVGVPFGVLYGLLARQMFDNRGGPWADLFATMTIGFLCLVPFAIGALTVALAPAAQRTDRGYVLVMPVLSTILWVGAAALLGWEAAICIVMASPLLVVMAMIGGGLTALVYQYQEERSAMSLVLLVLLAPFVVTPLELRQPIPDVQRHVATSIVIDAPAARIWPEIVNVPTIQEREQGWSMFHLLGLPRPLAAIVSHEGVGGVRQATFEGGLAFVETVDRWEPMERLGFSIVVDRTLRHDSPLDMIGSHYLDVLYGEYRLEPLADGSTRLHLTSDHRLATRFNWYGTFWSDWIMHDLQGYILRIIKARAERA